MKINKDFVTLIVGILLIIIVIITNNLLLDNVKEFWNKSNKNITLTNDNKIQQKNVIEQ